MTVMNVLKMGDPCLAIQAEPVTDFSANELQTRVADMIDTMRYYSGVGLAAPQIGVSQRIIVLEVADNSRYPQAQSITLDVLINPQIIEFSEQQESAWEGCLSLPGMRGKVTRSLSVMYQAQNLAGEQVTKTVSGFHARIIQHEMDHLDGILYPQRIDDLRDFGFEQSLPAFQQAK